MKIIERKRKRQKKTNYLRRKRMLESKKPRVIIRKTNRYIIIQYVETKLAQDKVKYTITSKELLKYGWPKDEQGALKNLAACYLTGLLFGNILKKNKQDKEPILDLGLTRSTPGSRIYAALKGIVDSGIKINADEKIFPDEKRIKNEKIKDVFDKVNNNIKTNG
jgi:large subunit ribosomal protein L18